jgi:hypothetical protein
MPGPSKPFQAVRQFSCAGHEYKVGDDVTDPVVLSAIAHVRDEFVQAASAASKSKEIIPPSVKNETNGA